MRSIHSFDFPFAVRRASLRWAARSDEQASQDQLSSIDLPSRAATRYNATPMLGVAPHVKHLMRAVGEGSSAGGMNLGSYHPVRNFGGVDGTTSGSTGFVVR